MQRTHQQRYADGPHHIDRAGQTASPCGDDDATPAAPISTIVDKKILIDLSQD
jgi:hypothetical protein